MPNTPRNHTKLAAAALIALTAAVFPCLAYAGSPAKCAAALPAESNVVILIDVEKLLASPLAAERNWKDRYAADYAGKPLRVPPETRALAYGSLIDTDTGRPSWEACVMDLGKPADLSSIATAVHGTPETLGGRPAVWTPNDVYFAELASGALATITPANRQVATRWLGAKSATGPAFLANLVATDDAVIAAIDLTDAASAPRVLRRIAAGEFSSIPADTANTEQIADVLGSLRGASLSINVTNKISGKVSIAFGKDAAVLAPMAKAIAVEAIDAAGMNMAEFADWTYAVKGDHLEGTGDLTPESFAKVVALVTNAAAQQATGQPAAPAAATAAPAAAAPAAATPASDPKIVASKAYYAAVSTVLSNCNRASGDAVKSVTLGQTANIIRREARRITTLPVMSVDPEMLAWGGSVEANLNRVAGLYDVGQVQVQSRAASVSGPSGGYSNDTAGRAQANREMMEFDRQRRQAALEEKSRVVQEAAAVFNEIEQSRAKLRASLAERLKTDF